MHFGKTVEYFRLCVTSQFRSQRLELESATVEGRCELSLWVLADSRCLRRLCAKIAPMSSEYLSTISMRNSEWQEFAMLRSNYMNSAGNLASFQLAIIVAQVLGLEEYWTSIFK